MRKEARKEKSKKGKSDMKNCPSVARKMGKGARARLKAKAKEMTPDEKLQEELTRCNPISVEII